MTSPRTEVRLVFTDVDGTLVGSSGVIPPRVWEAASRLRARGIGIAVCSGRPAFGNTLAYARELEPAGFHVFQNGASILHLGTGESISRPISAESVARLVARARRTGQFLELYSDHQFAFEGADALAIAHARLLGVPFESRPFSGLNDAVVRAQWILPHEEIESAIAELTAGFEDLEVTSSTSPLMPDITFVMLTLRDVNKRAAVAMIAARAGIDLESVMFVGDGDNDVVALRAVGCPVAMSNGSPAARAAALHVVGDVEAGSVADAFALALALPAKLS